MAPPILSHDEAVVAVGLLRVDAATWRHLSRLRLTTDAERELFLRNSSILTRIADAFDDRLKGPGCQHFASMPADTADHQPPLAGEEPLQMRVYPH